MASERRPASNERVNRETAGRAVDALLKWMRARAKQRKAQLLEHDDLLHLVLTLKKIPHRGRTKAHRVPLPHPLHSLDPSSPLVPSICLLVDDSPKSALSPAAARAQLLDLSLPVSEVIGLSQLGADYHPFEARRKLCDSHDLFFADRRIIPLLPRLLGKHFFKKKKIPMPLELGRKSWPEQLRQCCQSTLLYLRTGTCSGVKVGRVSQDREEIIDNVMAAIERVVQHVPKKWANVRSLHIKSVDSLALPIYQALPEMGLKIDVGPSKKEKKRPVEGAIIQEEGDKGQKPERKLIGAKNKVSKRARIHQMRYTDGSLHDIDEDEDDVGMQEDAVHEEGFDELSLENRVSKKRKKDLKVKEKKDKKGKKGGGGDDAEIDGDGVQEVVEIGNEDLLGKKTSKKDAKEKMLKKDSGLGDGLNKRKSNMKMLEDKGLKKIKKSKI